MFVRDSRRKSSGNKLSNVDVNIVKENVDVGFHPSLESGEVGMIWPNIGKVGSNSNLSLSKNISNL